MMKRFERISIFFRFVFVILIVASGSNCTIDNLFDSDENGNNTFVAVEPFSYTVAVAGQQRFVIFNVNGSIDIQGETGLDSVYIWGEKEVRAKTQTEADDHLDDLAVEITTDVNAIQVDTEYPESSGGRNYEVEYHVRIPINLAVAVGNTNGSVNVDSLMNDADVGLVNGNVNLEDIAGEVDVDLVNGNVNLRNIEGNAVIGLSNGQIDAGVDLPAGGTCDFEVVNGNIDLDIPSNTSAQFSAGVVNGSISLTGLTLTNPSMTNQSAQGTLGNGDGTIRLRTVNGNIVVTGL